MRSEAHPLLLAEREQWLSFAAFHDAINMSFHLDFTKIANDFKRRCFGTVLVGQQLSYSSASGAQGFQ